MLEAYEDDVEIIIHSVMLVLTLESKNQRLVLTTAPDLPELLTSLFGLSSLAYSAHDVVHCCYANEFP